MRILIGACLLLAASPGLAQAQQQQSGADRLGDKAENIVRQPVKDVGLMRENPPEVLKDAQRAPYSLAGIKRCQDIRRAIGELDVVLGPDVDAVDLGHLLEQQRHQVVGGQLDGQLVDRPTGAALEDVDADDVAADRADPARHGTEGTRPVGQPQPHHEGAHGRAT